jgi:type IV pilus assembly protein PilC
MAGRIERIRAILKAFAMKAAKQNEAILEKVTELVNAGVPLVAGLRAAADDVRHSSLARKLNQLADQLAASRPLDKALSEGIWRGKPHVPTAICAGLQSGRLGQVLIELVEHQRFQNRVRGQLMLSLFYPFMLILVFSLVLAVVVNVALPQFLPIFDDFGVTLPRSTRVLMWLNSVSWQSFSMFLLIIPVAMLLTRLVLGPSNWRLLLGAMPVFGPLLRLNGAAQFARLLPIFLRQQLPLHQALEYTASGVNDANVADATRGFAQGAQRGASLCRLMQESHRVPATMAPVIAWGEQHDRLPEALDLLADVCEGLIRQRTGWLTTVIPPITFVAIAAAVSGVVVGLYLPLVTLIENLS